MEITISIVEAAKRSGLSRSSIYESIGRGDLKIRKHGRRSLVLVEDLKAMLAALPVAKSSKIKA